MRALGATSRRAARLSFVRDGRAEIVMVAALGRHPGTSRGDTKEPETGPDTTRESSCIDGKRRDLEHEGIGERVKDSISTMEEEG